MKTLAIIQARYSSRRFPGKMLADLCGKPVLQHVVERVEVDSGVDAVVVAFPYGEAAHFDDSAAAGADYAATFTENGGAVTVADADAVLSDVDDANLASLAVTITNLLDGASEALSADTTGTSITASYNSGTGVLTLSGADTTANYQQVLRTVSYNNTSESPDTTARSITFTANDGTSDSNTGVTTVTMVAQDDAPVLDLDADDSAAAGADYAARR